MIPRTLVPTDARLPAGNGASSRRRPTTLDQRTLVPAMLPVVRLNGHSTIPANLPLESIAARVVVPRDVKPEAYAAVEQSTLPPQPSDLDERIAIPVGAVPPPLIEPMTVLPPADIVEPDIFMTGEVNLVPEPPKERTAKWQFLTRVGSVVFHVVLISLLLLQNKLFPTREPTAEEVEIARKQLTFIAPNLLESRPSPVRPPQPPVKVDPRVLRRVAPPAPAPEPVAPPPPVEKPRELPSTPKPQVNATPPEPAPQPKAEAPKPGLKLETPETPKPNSQLILPKASSPGQSIQDSLKGLQRPSNPAPIFGGSQIPIQGGGGAGGTVYGGIEMLTPDDGVNFSDYLNRVYITVKRNWFAVMPPSVELGEKGIVQLTFKIMSDGSVPNGEPVIWHNSGKEPLDRAAYSSVRASNPFEPLPPKFKRPNIELRYTYFYNIDPRSVNGYR